VVDLCVCKDEFEMSIFAFGEKLADDLLINVLYCDSAVYFFTQLLNKLWCGSFDLEPRFKL